MLQRDECQWCPFSQPSTGGVCKPRAEFCYDQMDSCQFKDQQDQMYDLGRLRGTSSSYFANSTDTDSGKHSVIWFNICAPNVGSGEQCSFSGQLSSACRLTSNSSKACAFTCSLGSGLYESLGQLVFGSITALPSTSTATQPKGVQLTYAQGVSCPQNSQVSVWMHDCDLPDDLYSCNGRHRFVLSAMLELVSQS